MWIFSRYIVSEVLKIFLIALLMLTLMTTLGMAVKDGLSRGLPPQVIAWIMPYLLPEMLGITIPVAILLAVTSVFGRMAGANEIVALKSLGVSPVAVIGPVLLVAFVLSLSTVSMYELAAVWGRPNVERIVSESVEEIAYGVLRAERAFAVPKLSIAVARVEGRKLIEPVITFRPQEDHPAIIISAAEAELRTDKEAGGMVMMCRNGEVEVEGQMRVSFPDTWQHVVPFDPPKRRVHRDWLALGEIPKQVDALNDELAEVERQQAAGVITEPLPEAITKQIQRLRRQIFRLEAEPYRRWSNGFSCLCFVLVGAPVAIARRSDNFLSSFFVCFLPILVVYYPLLMLQEDLATSGVLPPATFWLGNVILLIPAYWFVRRVIRY